MKIAIIGFGNLGKAFAGGLLKSGFVHREGIYICAKSDETLEIARQEYGFKACKDAESAIKDSGLVVFAVKANVFKDDCLVKSQK